MLKSIEYFKQAIAREPGYALAYAGLADAYAVLSYRLDRKDYRDAGVRSRQEGDGTGRQPGGGACQHG